jgi:prepilin-type N-terminal cleavage/methylation domain-containing protein
MLTNRLYRRTASSRGGFTLVELLVVIGIIAILAGVALGPITSGIKKAKESGAVQESHALGLAMYSAANDASQTYPDSTGSNASDVAKTLLAGGYVTDPSIFYISGGSATKYAGAAASAVSSIAKTNISWDFAGATGSGLNSTQSQFAPLIWNSIAGDTGATQVNVAGYATTGTAITAVAGTNSAFGQSGVACFYINNSAAFIVAQGGSYTCTLVTGPNNSGGLPATAVPSVNAGGG